VSAYHNQILGLRRCKLILYLLLVRSWLGIHSCATASSNWWLIVQINFIEVGWGLGLLLALKINTCVALVKTGISKLCIWTSQIIVWLISHLLLLLCNDTQYVTWSLLKLTVTYHKTLVGASWSLGIFGPWMVHPRAPSWRALSTRLLLSIGIQLPLRNSLMLEEVGKASKVL
jgi:hypothetical protein